MCTPGQAEILETEVCYTDIPIKTPMTFVDPRTLLKKVQVACSEEGGGLVGNSASSLKKTQFKLIYTKLIR